jgi:hypothetical protein
MTSTYHDGAGTLMFFGKTVPEEGLWYGFGLLVHLTNEQGDGLSRVSVITPRDEGGTVTYTFPAARTVRWLSLEVGDVGTSPTEDGKYVLSVSRSADATWALALRSSPGEQAYPWVAEGSFELAASSPRPPWDALDITFSASGDYGDASGNLHLRRRLS